MIISELRDYFVTIVTGSAFFVTIIVTESDPISKKVYIEETKNTRVKEKKGMFSAPLRLVKIM